MTAQTLQNELKLKREEFKDNCTSLAQKFIELCLNKIKTEFSNEFVTSSMLGFEIENLDLPNCNIELGLCWAIPYFKTIEDYHFIPFTNAVRDLSNEMYYQLTFTFTQFVEELKSLGFEVYVSEETGNLIPFFAP